MGRKRRILVVDDHPEMVSLLRDQLTDAGYSITTATSGRAALEQLRQQLPDLVVTDLRMEEVDGFDLLQQALALDPELPVIIMTAFGSIDTAVDAIKRGAYHYVTKPLRLDELLVYVERALAGRRMTAENRSLRRLAGERTQLGAMIGRSRKMQQLFELAERVAQARAPVLIAGESGTGKELVARALHLGGPRREQPFVPVNCSALPDSLLESELFGHVRGSFTGATAARGGLFLEADGGTLFLDEIGEMELGLQAKLLRVIEDGEVRAVGADTSQRVDVRIIAASNRDLAAQVAAARFREDLFYRLNVVPMVIPPLRERPEDIPILADHFLNRARERNPHSPLRELSPAVISELGRRSWPGNVRELENLIERLAVVATEATVELADLELLAPAPPATNPALQRAQREMISLRQLESDYIEWVIERCEGNKTRAAEILGVDVSTIHRRRQKQ